MKKVLLPLCVTLLGAGLIGCGSTEKDYTLNFGSTVSFTTNAETQVVEQISILSFAVVFDADEKVVSSYTDEVQIPLTYANGTLSYDASKTQVKKAGDKVVLSKRELGTAYDSYNPMPKGTWYVQADAYQDAINGKTLEEIKALTQEELTEAGCSMGGSVATFVKTLEAGQQEVHTTKFTSSEEPKVGVGMVFAAIDGGTVSAEIGAVAYAGDKVAAANFDAYQAPTAEGKLDTTKTQVKKVDGAYTLLSKKDLKEAYDSYDPMKAGTWLVQANAFEDYIIGKTSDEIQELTIEELTEVGCSMYGTPASWKAIVEEATTHLDGAGYTGDTLAE